jgi:hypothetical protein
MRKTSLILAVAAASLSIAGAASAGTGPAHGAFSLTTAYRIAQRYEQVDFPTAKIAACRWATVNQRAAFCNVSLLASIVDGTVLSEQTWTDTVTRSGSCSTPVTRPMKPGHLGIASGHGASHDCFTGPVVVL